MCNADILNLQCTEGTVAHNFNFDNYPECSMDNSCILLNIDTAYNQYTVDRILHEFKCLIFADSLVYEMPDNIFMTLKSNITHLHANGVSMSELHRKLFPVAQKLTSVDLSGNVIKELRETVFYDAPNLKSLNLSNNLISEFSSNAFEMLESLERLDLSSNQIATIPFDLLQPLNNNLVYLNLRANRLQLRFGIFPESLRILDLSYNNLEIQQKFKIFALLENLDTLLLHGNRIEGGIPHSIFQSNIRALGFSENLFSCNVLADIIILMKEHRKELVVENAIKDASNIHGIRCTE
jgi:Leucine rich repeat